MTAGGMAMDTGAVRGGRTAVRYDGSMGADAPARSAGRARSGRIRPVLGMTGARRRRVPAVIAMLLAGLAVLAGLAGLAGPASAMPQRLVVRNFCPFPVWMVQEGLRGVKETVRIRVGRSSFFDVKFSDEAILTTRIRIKAGCDGNGENCTIGERLAAKVNSGLEATWCQGDGCRSWFSLEFGGGYTLPVSVQPRAPDNTVAGCSPAACPTLTTQACPRAEDLSTGGAFPQLARQDLRMRNPKNGDAIGCFSPCGKLTSPARVGGLGFKASDREAQAYCCTGAFAGSEACRAGPVDRTKYAKLVDQACDGEADAWAYDRAHGLHTCTGPVRLVYTVCPKG
jgi:hypothetical protein